MTKLRLPATDRTDSKCPASKDLEQHTGPSQSSGSAGGAPKNTKSFSRQSNSTAATGNKVQDYVGTRTSTQARSHAQKVLPHPSCVDGANASHNSTSTTLTKSSPHSNKNEVAPELNKAHSVAGDDENSSEFAIFKVEKVRNHKNGRDRVNSENNVFRFCVDDGRLDKPRDITGKQAGRKYSVNVDFVNRKSDLIASPIKEPIKEQVNEDEEELKEGLYEPPIIKHNTFNSKSFNLFEDNGLFGLRHKENDFHLDISDILYFILLITFYFFIIKDRKGHKDFFNVFK